MKQEEIKEGIRDIIESYCDFDSEATYQHFGDEILSYLASQGLAFVYDIQAPMFGKQWAKFEPLIKE